jgi:dienelactone hydrolase
MSCPDCFKGAIRDGEPAGKEEIIHGIRTYVAGLSGASNTPAPRPTIIFITDAFGFNLPNSKLLADYYASKTGFRVLVPDIIPHGGVPLSSLALMEVVTSPVKWWDIFGQFRRIISLIRLMFIVIPFSRRTKNIFPSILQYVRSVRAEGEKLGLAGFCWGGLQSTKLSQESAVQGGKEALVDAHFIAHPAGLKVPDDFVDSMKKFDTPLSIAVGDRDFVLSEEKVAQVEAALRTALGEDEERFEVRIYEYCGHGFAVRADPGKMIENEAAGQAAEQAVEWFKKFLN